MEKHKSLSNWPHFIYY